MVSLPTFTSVSSIAVTGSDTEPMPPTPSDAELLIFLIT